MFDGARGEMDRLLLDASSRAVCASVDARYLKRRGIGISAYLHAAIESMSIRISKVILLTDDASHAESLTAEFGLEALALPAVTGFLWEQVSLPLFLRKRRPDVHVAGANVGLPLLHPRGTALTVVVHDLIPIRFPLTYLARKPLWGIKYLASTRISLVVADLVIANS